VARAASTAAANVAYDAMVRGRYGEALAGYEAVLEREPGNVEALSHAAILAAKAGQDGRALRLLDQVLAMDPRFPTTLLIRGELFYRASDMRAAIAALDRYLAVAPAGPDRDTAERLLASARRQRSAPAR
jgi:tetratricopeptide (TPR) repeat protein